VPRWILTTVISSGRNNRAVDAEQLAIELDLRTREAFDAQLSIFVEFTNG
jgi:hypothetical protein